VVKGDVSEAIQWRDVSAHRPDDDELVLLWCTGANEPLGMGWLDTHADIWRSSEGVNLNAIVTHWARVQGPSA
jgi:hypothetical protein